MYLLLRCLSLTAVLVTGTMTAADNDAALARRRTPVVEVFESARDAVVNISTTRVVRMRSLGFGSPLFDDIFPFRTPERNRRVQSVGSGFAVHESGYIVTNAHVVSQASDVQVMFANKDTLPAEIVAVDPEHDLAVVRIDPPEPIPTLRLGRSDDLLIGETVVAIGNPLGLQHTVTAGIISALGRELFFSDDVVYRGLIQTDAPINPGNSGGPLLNINGHLIGVNTAIRGDAQNIGFAIPVDQLWELVPAMLDIERRKRVKFGLHVSGPDATVIGVRADTPAAGAGIQGGDQIVALNGEKLHDAIDYHVRLLKYEPDDTVKLTLRRGDDQRDVKIELQSVPLPDGRELARNLLGLELTEIPADLKRRYDLPDHVGLVVEDVVPNGPAARARIRPVDVILRLNRVSVATLQDVGLALEQIRDGERVVVEGLRLKSSFSFHWTVTLRALRKP